MTTPHGPVCDRCFISLDGGCFVTFFFPELRYCSESCLQAAEADRRRESRRTAYQIERYRRSRFWAVLDGHGELICLVVYKKGAQEVVRRLSRTSTAK